jgi:hypothetical protein
MYYKQVILFILLSFSFIVEGFSQIKGRWDLVENETIESIRNSQGFQLSDFETQSFADRLFTLALDSVFYEFRGDTLYYQDLDTEKIRTINRTAFWSLDSDTLYVKEIDRIYFRKYYVKKLTSDSLWIRTIFEDGVVSRHSLKFLKLDE